MLAYATLGTRDLARAAAFYDAVLAPLGWLAGRLLRKERHPFGG